MSNVDVESLIGKTLGNYQIERELGRGGMGIVYKAHEESLQRVVALKILSPSLLRDKSYVQRFLREAQAGARLHHPSIVPIHAVGKVDDYYFIAMAYVKGERLSDVIRREGQLPVNRALDIARQVADALAEAHQHNIVHRDIKPENIMIDRAGRVQVMDFGLAHLMSSKSRLTGDNSKLGTPYYMAPEQCQNGELDGRTDLYALGIVLFEMLAGRAPFKADSPMAVMYQIVKEPLPALQEFNSTVPPEVVTLVQGLTAKDKERRYPSATMVRDGILELQQGRGMSDPAPPSELHQSGGHGFVSDRPTGSRSVPIKKVGIGLGALTLVAAIAVVISRFMPSTVDAPETDAPEADATEEVVYASESERLIAEWPPLPAPPERVVNFPDRSIGTFGVRRWNSDMWRPNSFHAIGGGNNRQQAMGAVTIPAGMELAIMIDGDRVDDFSFLDDLEPHDAQGIEFSNYEPKVGDLEHIGRFSSLRLLNLTGANLPASEYAHLEGLHYLKVLELGNARILGDALKPLLGMPYLVSINLEKTNTGDTEMNYLANTTNLVNLNLWDCNVSDHGIKHIGNNKKLRYLHMFANDLSNEGLRTLSDMHDLELLFLAHNGRIGDAGLRYLIDLPNLRRLVLDGAHISNSGLVPLADMELTELNIGFNARNRIDDGAIYHLLRLTTLESLGIQDSGITPDGLRRLSALPRLQRLHLFGSDFVTGTVDALVELKHLRTLFLSWGPPLSLEAAGELVKLRQLEEIEFASTKIDDRYIESLSQMTHLKKLRIGETKVTRAGIAELRELMPNTVIDSW